MHHVISPTGVTLSYDRCGSGPALVLVHGSFSDHHTNWASVKPLLAEQFEIYSAARRGRGQTDATQGHSVHDEAADIAALIEAVEEPAFLVGHSYGSQVALAAAGLISDRVRKLVLYEPPLPDTVGEEGLTGLEAKAASGDWDGFVTTFFHEELKVPIAELESLRGADAWAAIVADAKASLGDIRAMCRYDFDPLRFRGLHLPVLLQVGTESPRELFATDALAAALPDARIEELPGQGHEAMQTAPKLYAESVTRFLLS